MSSLRFSADIHCPHCGQNGVVFYEESKRASAAFRDRALMLLSCGFHLADDSAARRGPSHIVCDRCETAQPELPGGQRQAA